MPDDSTFTFRFEEDDSGGRPSPSPERPPEPFSPLPPTTSVEDVQRASETLRKGMIDAAEEMARRHRGALGEPVAPGGSLLSAPPDPMRVTAPPEPVRPEQGVLGPTATGRSMLSAGLRPPEPEPSRPPELEEEDALRGLTARVQSLLEEAARGLNVEVESLTQPAVTPARPPEAAGAENATRLVEALEGLTAATERQTVATEAAQGVPPAAPPDTVRARGDEESYARGLLGSLDTQQRMARAERRQEPTRPPEDDTESYARGLLGSLDTQQRMALAQRQREPEPPRPVEDDTESYARSLLGSLDTQQRMAMTKRRPEPEPTAAPEDDTESYARAMTRSLKRTRDVTQEAITPTLEIAEPEPIPTLEIADTDPRRMAQEMLAEEKKKRAEEDVQNAAYLEYQAMTGEAHPDVEKKSRDREKKNETAEQIKQMGGRQVGAMVGQQFGLGQTGQMLGHVTSGGTLASAPGVGMAIAVADELKGKVKEGIDAVGSGIASIGKLDTRAAAEGLNQFVGAIIPGGEFMAKFNEQLFKVTDALSVTAQKLAPFSPELAVAQGNAQIMQIQGDIRRAQQLGPELAKFVEARTKLEQLGQDALAKLIEPVIPIITEGMNLLIMLLEKIVGNTAKDQKDPLEAMLDSFGDGEDF